MIHEHNKLYLSEKILSQNKSNARTRGVKEDTLIV
jgi:hypothetical protein